ncbi:hypothetical protein [Cohnella sp. GbtcB17]|uniref:hypothetical protein n=1 Tax=Cohnella sp. GbtcB17 TaxID=2824762 RepID=UPI001C2F7527|nr:hypothetical protein [Cohnella sp. GbtcB17]
MEKPRNLRKIAAQELSYTEKPFNSTPISANGRYLHLCCGLDGTDERKWALSPHLRRFVRY